MTTLIPGSSPPSDPFGPQDEPAPESADRFLGQVEDEAPAEQSAERSPADPWFVGADDHLAPYLADGADPENDTDPDWWHVPSWAVAGPAVVVMALGLLAVAQTWYVVGLVVIVSPAVLAVVSSRVATSTRVVLAVAASVLVSLSHWVVAPDRFLRPEELWWLIAVRGEQAGSPGGLQVAVGAVGDLTGWGAHTSAMLVLLSVQLVVALAVLLLVGWLTRSLRIGATAVLVLTGHPQVLGLDGSFAPRSLAMPLAVLTVYLVLSRLRGARTALMPAVAASWAVAVVDVLTSVVLVLLLLGWALAELVAARRRREDRAPAEQAAVAPAVTALGAAVGAGLWLSLAGAVATTGPPRGWREVVDRLDPTRGAGEAVVLAASLLSLVVLLVALWSARRLLAGGNGPAVTLVVLAALLLVVPAALLSDVTVAVGDRVAGLALVGAAFVVAWWVWQRPVRARRSVLLGAGAAVLLFGNVVLGAGEVGGRGDADALAATRWMSAHLPSDGVVHGNGPTGLLVGAYAGLVPADRVTADVRYLVVDRREKASAAELDRYAEQPGVDVVYDSGSVVVYDLGRRDAP